MAVRAGDVPELQTAALALAGLAALVLAGKRRRQVVDRVAPAEASIGACQIALDDGAASEAHSTWPASATALAR